ncbi:LPS translocon maturation chaperone LptM [Luteimonas saliphila]|uniref:LPS translocon maturation chaperone LptM n=1 Tax=Luteimonas saliphila TaxID=2804919 RepID=UPI00192E050F|nr:lipoprotein [Luteimonas saliphila]
MRTSTSILAPLALLLAFNLAACGNKGPLVRPSADVIEDVEDVEDVEELEQSSDDEPVADPDEAAPPEDIPVGDTDEDAGVDAPPPAEPDHG